MPPPRIAPPPAVKAPATTAAIELLRENSLATLAHSELERRIVSGELASGTKLNEVDIATALGVSRGPVREAFRALAQSGLVRVEKNRGVFVREVTLDEANEIYEVRAALEGLIGRLASERAGRDELTALRAVVQRMHSVDRGRRAEGYFALNVEFHDLLAAAAHNRALHANYRRVVNELDLYRRETIARGAGNIPLSTQEHEAILEAIERRDAATAERLCTQHVLVSRERLHRALGRSSDLPSSGG